MNHSKHLIITLSSALSVLVIASAVFSAERKTYEVEDFTDKNSSSVKTWAAENSVPSDMVLYTHGYSDEVGKGKIISQSVKPGEKLSSPDYITVRVSDGKNPNTKTLIPDFTGKKLDEIRKWFEDNGFDNVSYGTQARDDLDEGSFIIVTPKSGSSVTKDDEITVITSVKPAPTPDATTDDSNTDDDSGNSSSENQTSVTPVPDQTVTPAAPAETPETPVPSEHTQKNTTNPEPTEELHVTPAKPDATATPSEKPAETDPNNKSQSDPDNGKQSGGSTDQSGDNTSKTEENTSEQTGSADYAAEED